MTPSASRNQSFKSMPAGAVVHEDLAAAMTPVRLLEKYLPKLQKSSSDFTAAWLKDPTPQGIANGLLSSTDELELSFLGWMRVFPCIQDAFRMSEYARQTSAPASMPPSPSTRRLSKDRKSCLVEDGGVSDSAAPSAHHPAGVAKATATVNESERVAPVRRKSWVRSTTRNKNSKEAAERRINIISSSECFSSD